MTIRTKLSLQFILITLGIYLLSLFFIYRLFKEQLDEEIYSQLESKARMTAEMVLMHEETLKPQELNTNTSAIQIKDIGNTSIYNLQLQRLYSLITSAPLVATSKLEEILQKGKCKMEVSPFKSVGLRYKSKLNNEYLIISEEVPDYSSLKQLRNILLLSTILAMLIVAAGAWFFAKQSLQPISRIIHEVNNILPKDLSKRLKEDDSRDEIGQLVSTFNNLLTRIEKAFETEKGFISNVSHELKNPLAAINSQIQFAKNKERSAGEYHHILDSLQDDIVQMTNTIEKLLQLARINSQNTTIPMKPIRVDELIFQSQEKFIQTHPQYRVTIDFEDLPSEEEDLNILGSESLLRLAIINLIENACKFSNDHTARLLLKFNQDNQAILSIQNFGEPIDTQDQEKIFQAFFRSPQHSGVNGSGIGLSLVRSVLDLHGFSLDIQSSKEEGNKFIITLNNQRKRPLGSTAKEANTVHVNAWMIMAFLGLIINIGCKKATLGNQDVKSIITQWNEKFLSLNENTDGFRPPVSARTFAYTGIGARQLACIENNKMQPWRDSFFDSDLPRISHFKLDVALNAYYHTIVKNFYPNATMTMKHQADDLYKSILDQLSRNDTIGLQSSIDIGDQLSGEIFTYSSQDSISRLSFLYNFDKDYKINQNEGHWQPTGEFPMPALLPHWGKAKMFIQASYNLRIKPPFEYSKQTNSENFAQAHEVYTISQHLTPEHRRIAEFWADDFHGVTYCASSRWISIALQACNKKSSQVDEYKMLDILMKVGIALNDAGVLAWNAKYFYDIERPETYIQRTINPSWTPLHDSPSFPSYPSGHSIFGGAASTILTDALGDHFKMTDESHKSKQLLVGPPRSFNSFEEMANENALSRMYLGVHYRSDCEEGLRLGKIIGTETLKLKIFQEARFNN